MDKAQIQATLEHIDVWLLVFGIIVVIGVGGESIFGFRHWWNSRKLQTIQEAEERQREETIANLNKEAAALRKDTAEALGRASKAEENLANANKSAADANAKAEGFRLSIAKANESAAQAQVQVAGATAEAAKANLELAKLKTPRTLSKQQTERIAANAKPFAGTPFDLWVNTDSDSTALMQLIDSTLRSAGWKFLPAGILLLGNKAGMIAASGVSIHVAEEHKDEWGPAIIALAAALTAEGIPTTLVADSEADKSMLRDRIHVMIGSKPLN